MEDGLKRAEELYVSGNIFSPEYKDRLEQLKQLPLSCFESADVLIEKRGYFEKNGVFPPGMIDAAVKKLKAYNDKGLSERLYQNNEAIAELVAEYIHVA